MTPTEIISALLGIAMIVKGLAILLEQKKFDKWIDKTYTEKSYIKWLAFAAGIVILYYAVPGVPLANILAIMFGFGAIMGGVLLIYPEETKKIAKKMLNSQYVKIVSVLSVLTGLAILYIIFV